MRPGPLIRHLFGRYERAVTEGYRRLFVDLDDFVRHSKVWMPRARTILEVGCGEGAMTERLTEAYREARITAIDISPNLGRLFRGDATRVTFLRKRVEEVARERPVFFDLVVLCDVLHHVPLVDRSSLLSAIDQAMAPGASLAFKDWAPSFSPIHWLCMVSDRHLTRDDVQFCTISEAKALICAVFGSNAIRQETLVRPWANNIAFLVQR
jgi:2-polyprenyl-3-methyl-5-hydroxy-6-metoxy-1,4-benzoquinol methylase